jgi:ankyrin repeat protein
MKYDGGALRYQDFNSFLRIDKTLYHYLNGAMWKKATESDVDTERVLMYLITTNNLTALEGFIDYGANVEIRLEGVELLGFAEEDEDDLYKSLRPTPLLLAADLDNLPLAHLLLKKGAKVEYRDDNGDGKYSPLHAARSAEMVELLIEHHANPDLADDLDFAPIQKYALRGHYMATRALLQHDVDVNVARADKSALHLAAEQQDLAFVNLLVAHGAAVNALDYNGETALFQAAQMDKIDVVGFLADSWPHGVRQANIDFRTPLHEAAITGNIELVKLLVERWPQGITDRDNQGNTPFHFAANYGRTNVVRFLAERWPGTLMPRNSTFNSPLHLAALPMWFVPFPGQMTDVVRLLVDLWPHGIKDKDNDANTPLDLALVAGDLQAEVVRLLMEREWASCQR